MREHEIISFHPLRQLKDKRIFNQSAFEDLYFTKVIICGINKAALNIKLIEKPY
jgi:hypothetical protein